MAGQSEDSRRAAHEGGSLRSVTPKELAEVLGLVIHDLRNPLAALSSNVGFLQMISKDISEDAREAVEDLLLSVEAMGRIVDSLELVGHDLADRSLPPPSPVSVSSVLRSLKAHAKRAARSHGLSLEIEVETPDSARIVTSEGSFSRALSALVHNALSVAPGGSTAVLRVSVRDADVVFRVEDAGPPIHPKLFPRVGRAELQNSMKSDRKARYSRGLGLFTVARSAQMAGARFCIGETSAGSALELSAPLAP